MDDYDDIEFTIEPVREFSVEYAGCGSHAMEITGKMCRYELRAARDRLTELLGEG